MSVKSGIKVVEGVVSAIEPTRDGRLMLLRLKDKGFPESPIYYHRLHYPDGFEVGKAYRFTVDGAYKFTASDGKVHVGQPIIVDYQPLSEHPQEVESGAEAEPGPEEEKVLVASATTASSTESISETESKPEPEPAEDKPFRPSPRQAPSVRQDPSLVAVYKGTVHVLECDEKRLTFELIEQEGKAFWLDRWRMDRLGIKDPEELDGREVEVAAQEGKFYRFVKDMRPAEPEIPAKPTPKPEAEEDKEREGAEERPREVKVPAQWIVGTVQSVERLEGFYRITLQESGKTYNVPVILVPGDAPMPGGSVSIQVQGEDITAFKYEPPAESFDAKHFREPLKTLGSDDVRLKKPEDSEAISSRKLMEKMRHIPIEDIIDWDVDPRSEMDLEYLGQLVKSIGERGQRSPILVRPHPQQPGKYQGLSGRTRVEALKRLGQTHVWAFVEPLSLLDAYVIALRENLEEGHGKPLPPLDIARHIKRIMDTFHLSQTAVAEKLHLSKTQVSRYLSLLTKLPPEAQEEVEKGFLKREAAKELATLPEDLQVDVLEKIKASGEVTDRGQLRIIEEAKRLFMEPETPPEPSVETEIPSELPEELARLDEEKESAPEKERAEPPPWSNIGEFTCPVCRMRYFIQVREYDGRCQHRLQEIKGEIKLD